MSLQALHRRPLVAALVSTLCLVTACAEVETEKLPVLTTTGNHSVLVGETVTVAATTANGTDSGYTFSSSDEAVATVSTEGVVTGVVAGEANIKVVGNDTKAETLHPIVVIDATVPNQGPSTPQAALWATSPHSDVDAAAFNYAAWVTAGAVPTSCAKCHSTNGFVDFVGGDGTAVASVEKAGTPKQGVQCVACHNSGAIARTEVKFPSGVTVKGLGPEARCMECHQGRASTKTVDDNIAASGVTSPDEASAKLGFQNVHYYPAAATLYAGEAKGGYQYAGQTYDVRFRHVESFDTCVECHDAHSTKVNYTACATCHTGATNYEGAKKIRQIASGNQDYDGDGNLTEGIGEEIEGLRTQLTAAIQRYATEKGKPICFGTNYPYHFNDTDGNGTCGAAETTAYNSWTARLERAAYNNQLAKVDPGAFVHNGKYVIQLLHDSLQDVNAGLNQKLDLSRLVRNDQGHFNGASASQRNWDANESVQASCSRCHAGSEGFRFFVQNGVGKSVPDQANGMDCATCHNSVGPEYTLFTPALTWMPDGTTKQLATTDNLCANCHIGRQSKVTIDKAFPTPTTTKGLQNVHYAPAAGTLYGSVTAIGYEFTGKTYAGKSTVHTSFGPGNQCLSCHKAVESKHTFKVTDVWNQSCDDCHAVSSPDQFRLATRTADYDGDGNVSEATYQELAGMGARLWTELRAFGTANAALGPICYDEHRYPYFLKDVAPVSATGACGTEDTAGYVFNQQMHRSAHNYQMFVKEHGAWAHNFNYMGQLLFDSVENLTGAPPTNMTRP